MSFVGSFPHSLDAKKRVFIPAKYREELGAEFYITRKFDPYLSIYTAKDWDTLVENYNTLPISQRSAATSLIFMNATQCNPDKQFRFSLTQFLLDYAGVGKDVMIVGRAGQAEIWDAAEFKQFEAENLTPEKLLASLEAIGL